MPGQLYIIGTPIGNLADMTPRGIEVLRGLDVLFCEDTRVTAKLLSHFGLRLPTRALSDDSGPERIAEAIAQVRAGKAVGFASDAGMPGISDPARRLTAAAWATGIVPQVIPGVSALATLLAACPFVENGFSFAGFAPRKPGERAHFVAMLRDSDLPQVFFDSPRRVIAVLNELCAAVEPSRRILVGREMTKLHEQIVHFAAGEWNSVRASIPELGEFSVAVAGRAPQPAAELDQERMHAALDRLAAAGFSRRDSARALAAALDVSVNALKKLGY